MTWKASIVSALLGSLSVLAFAPFELYFIAILTMAALAYMVSGYAPIKAFKIGLCFGLGLYLTGVSWVYVSLSTYGGMPLWMGCIAVLGFALLLALFTGFATGVSSYLAQSPKINFYMIFPFVWVVFEWCKSWVLTGFPWLDIAYTQTSSWLSAWAPVGGIYLVSFVLLVFAMLLLNTLKAKTLMSRLGFGTGLVLILFSSYGLDSVRWTSEDGELISVGVVQANVAIEGKWQAENQRRTIQTYRELGHELAQGERLDLLVLPETAMPLYMSQTDQQFWNAMTPENTALLTGVLDYDGENSYNAAALNCANSELDRQVYRKRHLVPFGEYQPLKFLFAWVFEYLQLPMSDFAGGEGLQPLSCDNRIKVGLSICYEDAFSNEYKNHLGDSSILINISEDAWFGDSLAPHQRRQFAQMRAKELGRPMVRAANSGPSLFIDDQGRLELETEQFEVVTARREIQPMQGTTPFMQFGSWIVWVSLLLLSGCMGLRLRFRLRNST